MYLKTIERLQFDEEKKRYSIVETGFRYEFPQSLYEDFKKYIFHYSLVSRWYKSLKENELDLVTRTSAY